METITITKRIINGKAVYNKKFDDYTNGFFGQKISRKEYEESKLNPVYMDFGSDKYLNIEERICYKN